MPTARRMLLLRLAEDIRMNETFCERIGLVNTSRWNGTEMVTARRKDGHNKPQAAERM